MTRLDAENKYRLDVQQMKKDIRTQGLEVMIASNPRNPTGQVIEGEDLKSLVDTARDSSVTLIMDEVGILHLPARDRTNGFPLSSTPGTCIRRMRSTAGLFLLQSSSTMSTRSVP